MPSSTSRGDHRQAWWLVLKIVLSLAILVFLTSRIGWSAITRQLDTLELPILLATLVLIAMRDVVRAKSWSVVLRALGKPLAYSRVLRSQLAGTFAGSAVPSGAGIDLARTLAMNRQNHVAVETALSSTVALNISSVFALCLVVSFSAIVLLSTGAGLVAVAILAASGLGLLIVAIGLIRPSWVTALFAHLRRKVGERDNYFASKAAVFLDDLDMFSRQRRLFATVSAIAVGSHALVALIGYSAALALGANVSFVFFLLFYPLVVFARLLPISFGTFGGEQAITVYLFSFAGMGAAEAFTVSFVVSSVRTVYVLLLGVGHVLAGTAGLLQWRRSGAAQGAAPNPPTD